VIARLALLLAVAAAGAAGGPAAGDPAALAARFVAAVAHGDEAAARALFTADAWTRGLYSPQTFFGDNAKRKTRRVPRAPMVRGDRAVVPLDMSEGKTKFVPINLYFTREGGRWRIGALDESEAFASLFLDGKLPVDFEVTRLRGSPELDALGQSMLAASRGDRAARSQADKSVAANLDGALRDIAELGPGLQVSTHLAADLGCALLWFQPPARPGASGLSVTVMLTRPLTADDRRWQFYGATYRKPSNEEFLEAWAKRDELARAMAPRQASAPPPLPRGRKRVEIAAGAAHTCIRGEGGDVVCWGLNDDGQVDPTLPRGIVARPVRVFGIDDAVAIAAGTYATCALRKSGKTICWGAGPLLGDVAAHGRHDIAICRGRCPAPPHLLALGALHACAAIGDAVACWGATDQGQSGRDGTDPVLSPLRLKTGRPSRLALGEAHSCALTSQREVLCWGGNYWKWPRDEYERFKDPPRERPRPIAAFKGALDVAAGSAHTCAIDAAGGVLCVGRGATCLVDGKTFPEGTPKTLVVPGVTGAIAISARESTTCAQLRTGEVMCWGENGSGQLGNGSVDRHDRAGVPCTPTRVVGIADAVQVAVGGDHTCALRRSGQVSCWGSNKEGQIGDGSRTDHATPVAIELP
jgi:alpha-tubulin suppressor-like RCC1 family protein